MEGIAINITKTCLQNRPGRLCEMQLAKLNGKHKYLVSSRCSLIKQNDVGTFCVYHFVVC